MNTTSTSPRPSRAEIEATYASIRDAIVQTPLWRWQDPRPPLDPACAPGELWLKLELFQRSGTFKYRAALATAQALSPEQKKCGLTAVSAGNHAVAVSLAAREIGAHAKVVMLAHSNAARVTACRQLGAEVLLAPDVAQAFTWVERIQNEEGRYFIHPFEGPAVARGTGTLGLELHRQCPDLDAVICPIGGGGLIAGLANALAWLDPKIAVYGVEPQGADTMRRSLRAGSPQGIDRVETIADSLGAPYAAPYSFSLCQRFVREVVTVHDDEMRAAMRLLLEQAHLAVEPAGAAATAALLGPLRAKLKGARVAVIVCGSNIDAERYLDLLAPPTRIDYPQ